MPCRRWQGPEPELALATQFDRLGRLYKRQLYFIHASRTLAQAAYAGRGRPARLA